MELWGEDLTPEEEARLELDQLLDTLIQLEETDPYREVIHNEISELQGIIEAASQK